MRRHVLTVVLALSLVIGTTSAWVALGSGVLYGIATISLVALVMVHLLRRAGELTFTYASAVLTGVLVVAAIGLLIGFGLLGVIWICVLGVVATPVRRLWRRFWDDASSASQDAGLGPVSPAPSPAGAESALTRLRRSETELHDLGLDDLCQLWRRTYFEILDAVPPSDTAAVAHYRQCILDEIDRRNPGGLNRWLATRPRPSSNPLPYLQSGTAAADDPGPPGPP